MSENKITSALALAEQFHNTYERLAPSFGYETRPETREFNPQTPNGRLMVAVCREIIAQNSFLNQTNERRWGVSDPIPDIQSAYLNIRQAMSDAEYATEKFLLGERKEAVVWITAAIAQLESARAKIEKETKQYDNRAVLSAVVGSFPDFPDCTDPFTVHAKIEKEVK